MDNGLAWGIMVYPRATDARDQGLPPHPPPATFLGGLGRLPPSKIGGVWGGIAHPAFKGGSWVALTLQLCRGDLGGQSPLRAVAAATGARRWPLRPPPRRQFSDKAVAKIVAMNATSLSTFLMVDAFVLFFD